MKKRIYIFICVLPLFLVGACDDFLTQISENNTTIFNHFNTEEDVEAAVYGMHLNFRSTLGAYIQILRDRAVLLDAYNSKIWEDANRNDFTAYPADYPTFSWYYEYLAISTANLVIGNIHKAGLPEERFRFYMGQALCIRAYLYFHLIRLWGDVPLVLKYEDLSEKARTPWREVAARVMEDLELAASYLPPADELKDSQGGAIRNKQIPSKGTAYAILAHVYAWMAGFGQEPEYYAKGIEAAGKVIGNPNYSLVDTPEEICTEVIPGNSREGIFEISYSVGLDEIKNYTAYIGGMVQTWPIVRNNTPATRRRNYLLNSTVEKLYEPQDLRLKAYFQDFFEMKEQPVSVTQGAAYVRMWRYLEYYSGGVQDGRPKTYRANEILIRLADIILLRAEMEAATGDREAAEADLNVVRRRAGASDYTASEGDLKRAIQLERDKELLFQTNVRYFDYMRNHTYNQLKGGFKTLTGEDVKQGALFLPISLHEMTDNPMTKQTSYWLGKF